MKCTRNWVPADALSEVQHLQNLRHAHIVQLVGTYLQGRNLSILMYPAADCDLKTFLEETADVFQEVLFDTTRRMPFLLTACRCLASAVSYVHDHTTKHMDIKPQNILIGTKKSSIRRYGPDWHVYLADFGLSRSFASQDHSQTDGPTAKTPKYCAPEVYEHDSRGRSADIFSLGCVFTEIVTILEYRTLDEFSDYRRAEGGDESFHKNLEKVVTWLNSEVSPCRPVPPWDPRGLSRKLSGRVDITLRMLARDPAQRPTATELTNLLDKIDDDPRPGIPKRPLCCEIGPEPYVAHHR